MQITLEPNEMTLLNAVLVKLTLNAADPVAIPTAQAVQSILSKLAVPAASPVET